MDKGNAMSVKKNYLYNLIYQIMVMIVPLLTVPYVSRVLSAKGVGIFAYTSSIAQYFTLLGMLGIGIYGNKMIAMTRDNKKEMSENFFSIYFLQLIVSLGSVLGYLLLVLLAVRSDREIALIQTITLLGTVIDCTWFFSGLEMFKKIVTRNLLIKCLSLVAVFSFVKGPGDLDLYTFIMCLSAFLGQFLMWFYIRNRIVRVKITGRSVRKHVVPVLMYFLPQVAMQVYFVLDKTMIGWLSSKSEVGIYDYADKIQKVAIAAVTSLGTVMLPRMAHTFITGQKDQAKKYIMKSLDFSTLLAVPIMFGLAGIAREFIPWYMGNGFVECATVLILISPTVFFMAWSGVFGSQYLLPLGKMRAYTISLYVGAIVNFLLNLVFIKPYGSIGASIGTLAAELSVTLVQIYFVRNDIQWKQILPKTVLYIGAGAVMYTVVSLIGRSMGVSIITTFVQVTAGVLSYTAMILAAEYAGHGGIILEEIRRKRPSYKSNG